MENVPVPKRAETFKIVCSAYPEIFELNKTVCKSYFRQFGKILRIIYKPKQRSIVIEYTNKNDYLNALSGPSEYDGHSFKVEPFEPPVLPPPRLQAKKNREKVTKRHKLVYLKRGDVKKHNINYIDNDEINAELAAMSGYSNVNDVIDLTLGEPEAEPQPRRLPKLNRVWRRNEAPITATAITEAIPKITPVKGKSVQQFGKKKAEKTKILTAEQLELLKVMKAQAHTVEEKYRVLDARDKLLRSTIKKSNMKSGPTVGTCPDMCPEKERLLREIQHQVSIYEQDIAGRHSIDPVKAVKQYSRSSADQESPLPHELRPESVLQMTMIYLMCHIMDMSETDPDVNLGEWFHFLWDRTRGIRKDITQQALCCQTSVKLVEQCARFHIHCSARLMGEDPSIFDQKINTENLTKCLQTLKYMYHDLELKGEKCSNEAEFRAYIILLNLGDGNFMWEVQKLRRDIQKSPEVKFALQIYSAFEKRNYVKFFKLTRSTTYLNTCILMRYFVQVRVQAIESLIKCFTPPKSISFYPVQQLTRILFFDDEDSTTDFMNNYGIVLNKDGTSFLIDRGSFYMPECSYILERSKGVDEKRSTSVGVVVSGQEISPELYMELQHHEVHNSFDKDGYLIHDDMFTEIESGIEDRLLDGVDSRESTPERKLTNIFASTSQAKASKKSVSPNIFTHSKEDKNIFAQFKPTQTPQSKSDSGNIFIQNKPEASNIFAQPKTDIFGQTRVEPNSNIFSLAKKDSVESRSFKAKDEVDTTKQKENIFASYKKSETQEVQNIFEKKSVNVDLGSKTPFEGKSNIFPKVSGNLPQDPRLQSRQPLFNIQGASGSKTQQNIFAKASLKGKESPKEPPGGFNFILEAPASKEVPNIFATGFKPREELVPYTTSNDLISFNQEDEIKKRMDEAKRQEEIRRKNEEAAERRRLEAERKQIEEAERKKREEEEKRRQWEIKLEEERKERQRRLDLERLQIEKRAEEERKKLEKEAQIKQAEMERRKKQLEEEQKRLEEEKKNKEIDETVKSVVSKMVETIDLKFRQETLKRIRANIKRRSLVRICRKWRNLTTRKVRKRKALDCNPIFVHTKSVTQCADDLHSRSQDLALSDMKRYKYGRPLDIPILREPTISPLRLFYLTYSSLRRKLCELKEKWHQHIYWKVVISIPDINEMITGLHKLEETLKMYVNWNLDKYGNTIYIEQHKTATYCIEKQQGFDIKSKDANAFVFIAKNFNDILQRRILENMKCFGRYVKLPVVVILEDPSNSLDYFQNLKTTGVISDFVIYSCNINSHILPSIIDNGFIFLAKGVEKYPPLEMDTLYSFFMTNLCTEIWKKAESYAKWNHEYNFCLRDPNIVINIYNQGLKLLIDIVTDKTRKEYARFPIVFREYLDNKIVPNFLPCNYRYFPTFWCSLKYEEHLKSITSKLRLPNFMEKWPPESETDLVLSVSKYCTDVLKNPKEPLINLLRKLKDVAEKDGFEKIMWTEAIQIIAQEKLKEQNLTLPKDFFSDVFSNFMVVYDINALNEYCVSEWFYRNNPVIESFKKITSNKLEEEKEALQLADQQRRKRTLDLTLDPDEVLYVISKAESVLRSPKNICLETCLETKSHLELLNRSIEDLEDSINVVKKIDEMGLFKRFME